MQSVVSSDASSPDLMRQLAQMLLFDPVRQRLIIEQARPLLEHLVDFQRVLASRDNPRHVRDTVRRVRKMVRLCRVSSPGQLQRSVVQIALGKLRLARPGRKTIGPATLNHYFGSFKTFCRWMVEDGRAERSPMVGLKPFPVQVDIRHKRRALSADDVLKLIRATINGPTIAGISGVERATTYLLATTTGLRAKELRTLTRGSFKLDGADPHVVVSAAYSKNKRRDCVPLRADVAKVLRGYLDSVGRDDRLFRFPANGCYALKKDLARAGIAYQTVGVDEGFADVHSLRHTFVSNLFSSSATPKEAQTLARHQDARLTLNRYAHVAQSAKRAAVERLPSSGADLLERYGT